MQKTIRVEIDTRTKYGNRYTTVREFNSDQHLENWLDYMHKKSEHQVIGHRKVN